MASEKMIEMSPLPQAAPIHRTLPGGMETIEDADKIAHYRNGRLFEVVLKPRPPMILPAPAGMRHLFNNGEPIAPMPRCKIDGAVWLDLYGREVIYMWYEDQANADD